MRKLPSTERDEEKRNEDITKLEKLIDRLEDMTTSARLKDIAYHFTDKKEVIKVNIIAGVARGVGLTLGTAVVLALFAYIATIFIDMPVIGEWIADLQTEVDRYMQD
ncbi:hypothetical protein DH09_03120 [Bacillaceae bacterium JMAK1]|nr:hypothetical protein DH09_03120 [Bacillaceae bacterium JMAK1]